MRPAPALALMLLLAACGPRPPITWPEGTSAVPPALLPLAQIAPPAVGPDPGPALQSRADSLKAALGLAP